MTRIHTVLAAIAALAISASGAAAKPSAQQPHALKGQALASQASVTLDQARATALKARPGKIVDQELEKEAGGSGLRYSFDIRVNKAVWEVGVDAKTGDVLENKKEGRHPD